MRDSFVDVTIEIPTASLRGERNPSQAVFERLEAAADGLCARNFGRLRTDKGPEILVQSAIDRSTGQDMLLVAARWPVVIPDAVAPQ